MYHVRKALISMPGSMELDKYYEWLDKEEGIGGQVIKIIITIVEWLLSLSYRPGLWWTN